MRIIFQCLVYRINIYIDTSNTAQTKPSNWHTPTSVPRMPTHSGSLKNRFDADKVQSELDLQRTVSQEFSQTSQQVNKAIRLKAKT